MNMAMTESAAKRILELRRKKNNDKLMLRVTVLGGGCSGFQYSIELDDQLGPDDTTFQKGEAVLVTDSTSMPFLAGAQVDFITNMMKSEFKIHNPNASAGCGCGASFAVKG